MWGCFGLPGEYNGGRLIDSRVLRWSNEHAGHCGRDRRLSAAPERHRECRTTSVDHSVDMVNYIENFYNLRQRLSSINYLTPNEFEQLHLTQTQTQTTFS